MKHIDKGNGHHMHMHNQRRIVLVILVCALLTLMHWSL